MAPHTSALLALAASAAMLPYFVVAFAHARVAVADASALAALLERGLLSQVGSAQQNFRAVNYLLKTVPDWSAGRERWVSSYFALLRISCALMGSSRWIGAEMQRVVAYQATKWLRAQALLAKI